MTSEKRKVTMTNVVYRGRNDHGEDVFERHEAVDHVPLDFLDAYVEDARKRWTSVDVGAVHDPGPGGDDGETHHPVHLRRGLSLEDHLDSLGIKHKAG